MTEELPEVGDEVAMNMHHSPPARLTCVRRTYTTAWLESVEPPFRIKARITRFGELRELGGARRRLTPWGEVHDYAHDYAKHAKAQLERTIAERDYAREALDAVVEGAVGRDELTRERDAATARAAEVELKRADAQALAESNKAYADSLLSDIAELDRKHNAAVALARELKRELLDTRELAEYYAAQGQERLRTAIDWGVKLLGLAAAAQSDLDCAKRERSKGDSQ